MHYYFRRMMKVGVVMKKLIFAAAIAATTQLSQADQLPLYSTPVNLASPACIGLGDVVSCSAPALNVLNGLPQSSTQPTGYVLDTSQGLLKTAIVVNAGGAAALDNQDTTPTGGSVDNGFKANVGSDSFFKMGVNVFEDAGGGTPLGDMVGTWDISLTWLRDALTFDNLRHDLMIGFDFNQPQNGVGALDIWSLITVRDVDGQRAPNTPSQINFELNSQIGNPTLFNSTKSFGDAPNSTDFVRVTNQLCVLPGGGNNAGAVLPVNGNGTCPAGYEKVDNAQSTSSTEFLNFIPELNAALEAYIAAGYDTLSVDVWMGCFGRRDRQGDLIGPALADGGETFGCDAGGFGDIFLLAAPTGQQVPEPGMAMLMAFALLGLGISLGHRRR